MPALLLLLLLPRRSQLWEGAAAQEPWEESRSAEAAVWIPEGIVLHMAMGRWSCVRPLCMHVGSSRSLILRPEHVPLHACSCEQSVEMCPHGLPSAEAVARDPANSADSSPASDPARNSRASSQEAAQVCASASPHKVAMAGAQPVIQLPAHGSVTECQGSRRWRQRTRLTSVCACIACSMAQSPCTHACV